MRRIEAKWKANYWCEEQFWCKVLELRVHWAIALCSEINWPKEQASGPVSTSNSISPRQIARHDRANQGLCEENRGNPNGELDSFGSQKKKLCGMNNSGYRDEPRYLLCSSLIQESQPHH
jgi:hypothetical protein